MSEITWDDLTYSLARHLESMPDDTYFLLCVDDSGRPDHDEQLDGHPLYVQFCAFAGDMIRCEVVGNRYLPKDRQHSVDDLIALRADGWRLPGDENINGSPNVYLDVASSEVDEAAAMVVRVFRCIWGVADPTGVITDREYLRGPHAFELSDAPAGFAADEPAA
jgi:hypothetical protein